MAEAKRIKVKMTCWKCKKEIDENDAYCRYCGMGQGQHIPFSYTLPGIIICFILLGPFALYFVARTPVMGRSSKIILSIIMLALFCYIAYGAYQKFIAAFQEAQQLLGTGMPLGI